jgi:homoserine kinase type II
MDKVILAKFINSFFEEENFVIKSMGNGANNVLYKVKVGEECYILKIYSNHSNIDKLRYEDEVLQKLKNDVLSFNVPAPIHTLHKEPYVLENGKVALLFPFIEGVEANRETINYRDLGVKVAELSIALQKCQPTIPPSLSPTYQLLMVHPKVNWNNITKLFHQSNPSHENLFFQEELLDILEEIELLVNKLPIQIIHGDLMFSNFLLKNGNITSILDYEFVSPDFRMSEVAITISQLIRENMDEDMLFINLSNFFIGYCSLIKPSDDEILALPTLIKIRMATLVFHFLGRYFDRLDTIDSHQNQLKRFYYVGNWINQNGEKIVQLFNKHNKN